jgi:2-oxoglutarate ferredoxin oxidoreductase subunit delta
MTARTEPAKRSRSYQVSVDDAVCDGCGICVFFCKPGVFEMSHDLIPRGVFPALPLHSEACNNCRLCELGCPQLAIVVTLGEEA